VPILTNERNILATIAEDVMDDADVAGLAMGWMSKGD